MRKTAQTLMILAAMLLAMPDSMAITATSNEITLVVNGPLVADLDMSNVYAPGGGTVTMTVTGGGGTDATYQWYGPGDVLIVGATSDTYSFTPHTVDDVGAYYCVETNTDAGSGGEITSNTVTLEYTTPSVTIASSPASDGGDPDTLTANPGATITWTATPSGGWTGGTPTWTYDWQLDGDGSAFDGDASVTGADNATMTIDPTAEAHEGVYTCVVDDGYSNP